MKGKHSSTTGADRKVTTLTVALNSVRLRMRRAKEIRPLNWQSIDVSKRPEALMMEVTNIGFEFKMPTDDLGYYRDIIKPNIPWADRHFEIERVSGQPINPGITWKEWPGGLSAEKFLRDGVFSHSYAERYWPRKGVNGCGPAYTMHGMRYAYGDLMDVVNLLVTDPHTRQAYLPVWFPEDTGAVHGQRVPCTLGYHFMMRDDRLSVFYPIRSCDYANHFQDDIYLTVRLVLWVLGNLRTIDPDRWNQVTPGTFTFWAGSLHCFINAWRKLFISPVDKS